MKSDLASAIGLAVVGIIISYLVCNIFVGMWKTDDYSVTTLNDVVQASIDDPNPNVFNFRSIDPTVEVYVGDCDPSTEKCDANDDGTNPDDSDNYNPDEQNPDEDNPDKENPDEDND